MMRVKISNKNVTIDSFNMGLLILNINKSKENNKTMYEMTEYIKNKYNISEESLLHLYIIVDTILKKIVYTFYINESSTEFYDLDYDEEYLYTIGYKDLDNEEISYIEHQISINC